MDDRSFDELIRRLALGSSRRSLLKAALGIGATASTGKLLENSAEAARRGYPGPAKPTSTIVAGPPVCTEKTCYGCHQCVNGVCTDNPTQNCYDHTGECLAAYCNPDGGCGYRFDCRVDLGCCADDQTCNTDGACVCPPNTCCGVQCPGCQECENGACVRKPENCYDHTAECLASVCDADGGCSYPFDCRVRAGCCPSGQVCSSSSGQCIA